MPVRCVGVVSPARRAYQFPWFWLVLNLELELRASPETFLGQSRLMCCELPQLKHWFRRLRSEICSGVTPLDGE